MTTIDKLNLVLLALCGLGLGMVAVNAMRIWQLRKRLAATRTLIDQAKIWMANADACRERGDIEGCLRWMARIDELQEHTEIKLDELHK